jgi:hypothetical protein
LSHLLASLGLSVAARTVVLTTRCGRLVLSSLRGGGGAGNRTQTVCNISHLQATVPTRTQTCT